MDDMKERLKTCSEKCFTTYEAWDAKKGADTREELQEAIHELRKVASRLEIEIALSERQKRSDNPIPIPSHRSNSKSKGAVESILPDHGNTEAKKSGKKDGARRPQRTRRPAPKRNDG
jgi:hypothetical protein